MEPAECFSAQTSIGNIELQKFLLLQKMSNVFGTPITDDYIKGLPNAPSDITAAVRAQYAMDYINEGNKNVDAQTFVDNLKAQYGNGITCRAAFYNATGGTLTFFNDHDYHGHIGASPYPLKLENGQWGFSTSTQPPPWLVLPPRPSTVA
ncbi:23 kDa jasmonate-induced protein-like [Malania oleifera]|uniref:23 kDa jasmonate-induced protein-like n=1 Tax=Malania oleifera TaxID=397392 RepID=UPI0025AE5060|nr:23 kDa jasmonate-induced protein-like [Malania oleifera]